MKKILFLFTVILLSSCNKTCLLSQVATQTITAGTNCSAPIPDFKGLVTVTAGCSGSVLTQTPLPGTIITAPNTTVVLKATSPNGKWSQTSFLMIMNIIDTITPQIVPVSPITPLAGYFVSPSGSDVNTGTIDKPWKSLSYTLTKVVPGDKVYFARGGEWRETFAPSVSGNSSNKITFDAYGTGALPVFGNKGSVTGWNTSGNWTNQGSNRWSISISGVMMSDIARIRIWLSGIEAKTIRNKCWC